MKTISREQVLLLHKTIFDRYGGSYGVRDENLLESALEAPFQTYAGQDLFQTDLEKIVRYGFGLIINHPFYDGNKRIGTLVLLTLLDLNGYDFNASNKELADIIYDVASGSTGTDYDALLDWMKTHVSK